jgi:hypothetical protein
MAQMTSDFFVERLYEWGVRTIFGYPGDGINGVLGALNRAEAQDRIHPGAARGNGGLHGLGPRQVHRRAGRLPVDRRPRRGPPGDRPVRRQARPHAGAGDLRPGRAAPRAAPTTSRKSTWSGCSRTWPTTCTKPPCLAGAAPGRPRDAHRPRPQRHRRAGAAQRFAGKAL